MTTLNISIQSQIKNAVESEVEFSVNFDDAWQWLEYSRKDAAKRVLVANFESNIDYLTVHNKVERQITEDIHLTGDCFKQLAMLSGTAKGKEVRLYFIKCEKELKEIKSLPKPPVDIVFMLEEAATAIREARLQVAAAESKVAELEPKADAFNILCGCNKEITIGELSKVMGVKELGPINIFKFLRKGGILTMKNLPMQKYLHLFNVVEKYDSYRNTYYLVPLVNSMGQEYIIGLVLEAGYPITSKLINDVKVASKAEKAMLASLDSKAA
ncbi:hypothetical protein CDG77_10175 [Nostoc sp. 'Peltigera membranacea cyanobiont' 213]|uniref:phage antirepressor KilAC domain-containing protein n=1 Tax=Nostoc sp. 'Peltigera membranacea cyanobiont' 213 TaxID=2014530 RepID=UPI000B9529E7|nr:phage antirepressor KilAC domain-containing protein [Nostoc sp. 'Peltigera membranacea cyanobiont' 213]OYD95912.1 hypothetical protein CDG77_10175 [Nostoc sp. 'Peltigera membranacea cyanobiont' 213]